MMNKNCIFHIPWAANDEMLVPSEIRPKKLIVALRNIGYEVDVVSGNAIQRSHSIKRIKSEIRKGKQYDFLYSESSTLPTALTEEHHYPTHPFLDFSFFSFCKSRGIPIGLFLRDIYWAFPGEYRRFSYLKDILTTAFHKYDIARYNRLLNVLFLPSLDMKKYVHCLRTTMTCVALPPGTEIIDNTESKDIGVFSYVGGISSEFRNIDALFEVFSELPDLKLIVSFPEHEWQKCALQYKHKLTPNITIFHYRAKELKKLYDSAGYSLFYAGDSTTSTFAMPYKLFEYISYEMPIICTKKSAVGRFVEENDIGYTFNNDVQNLKDLIVRLSSLDDYHIKRTNLNKCREANTWEVRAKQIASTLCREK